ncbi:MAG: carboxyl transferase domain-containing protein [Thermoleophilaceae bacterium]
MTAVLELAATGLDPARARIELLCDPGTFRPWRTAVGDGVVAGRGRSAGRPVFCWAQDGGHVGGSLGAAGGETIARTFAAAERAGAPVVGFPHSGGARLQQGVAALAAYGSIFREQANATVPQVAVVSGPCAGGAAYSPALGDLTVMCGPEARMFLTGPRIVEEVTRERVSAGELGGAAVQGANGVAHAEAPGAAEAGRLVRDLLAHLPARAGGSLPLAPAAEPEPGDPSEPVPAQSRRVYDVRDVARRLTDAGRLLELAPRWAPNLVTALARIDGSPVGVIANQPRRLGGTIDCAAAEKGAWFVTFCDRFGIPLLVLVDTPGFLPGVRQERDGVIRHGAAFLRAFARARVPRVTVTLRQAYGGAYIVMNSRDLGADLSLAWPQARIGVMGAKPAVGLLERRAIAAGADAGALAAAYEGEHLGVDAAAHGGFVDEVIAPEETRARVMEALA